MAGCSPAPRPGHPGRQAVTAAQVSELSHAICSETFPAARLARAARRTGRPGAGPFREVCGGLLASGMGVLKPAGLGKGPGCRTGTCFACQGNHAPVLDMGPAQPPLRRQRPGTSGRPSMRCRSRTRPESPGNVSVRAVDSGDLSHGGEQAGPCGYRSAAADDLCAVLPGLRAWQQRPSGIYMPSRAATCMSARAHPGCLDGITRRREALHGQAWLATRLPSPGERRPHHVHPGGTPACTCPTASSGGGTEACSP